MAIPFAQASGAEQLRVSVAMGLAMNPKLKVLLVRDSSLLDDDSRALIAEMAEKADAQLWLEVVGTGKEVSVVIEDGAVCRAVVPTGGVADGRPAVVSRPTAQAVLPSAPATEPGIAASLDADKAEEDAILSFAGRGSGRAKA